MRGECPLQSTSYSTPLSEKHNTLEFPCAWALWFSFITACLEISVGPCKCTMHVLTTSSTARRLEVTRRQSSQHARDDDIDDSRVYTWAALHRHFNRPGTRLCDGWSHWSSTDRKTLDRYWLRKTKEDVWMRDQCSLHTTQPSHSKTASNVEDVTWVSDSAKNWSERVKYLVTTWKRTQVYATF